MKKQFLLLAILLPFLFQTQVSIGQVGLKVGSGNFTPGTPTIIGETNPSSIITNNAMLNIISTAGSTSSPGITAGIHLQRLGLVYNTNAKISLTGSNGQNGLFFQVRNGSGAYEQPLKLMATGQVLIGNDGNDEIPGMASTHQDVKLFVEGAILAEELRIELGWADYVFEEDYSLPTLGEVESFIQENGHLPAIPSAAEIESKGLNVGSMTVMQQEKIEELFLYMIDLKKEMDALSIENQELKQELKSLQAKQ